ncbi:hypothetical protein ID866_4573 [Astraeus odoratus]|nr:hypothetical protein ID866_4573 [Astraeus odoratus]
MSIHLNPVFTGPAMSPEPSPSDAYDTACFDSNRNVAPSDAHTPDATVLHPSCLPASNSQRPSCSSPRPQPAIRFAPLPKIDPSRKRSVPPLGVPARSRRKRMPQEGGSLLWAVDPVPEETVEDPILVLGRLVKKAGVKMWQTVRKRSVIVSPQEKDCFCGWDVIDIKADGHSVNPPAEEMSAGDTEEDESGVCNDEEKRLQRATWTAERGALPVKPLQLRRSTGDLSTFSRTSS